jgi:hypothetical protein
MRDQLLDVDPNLAAHLDPAFQNTLLGEIDYCDQTESPPMKAIQTNALLFRFAHENSPNHRHAHVYKGVLVYSPPIGALSLGSFSGTGCLVAHAANDAIFDEVGTLGPPFAWVRIGFSMRRSGALGPEGFHTVSITGGFTFSDTVAAGPGGPGGAGRYFEADLRIENPGSPGGGEIRPPHLVLTNTTTGEGGTIQYTRSTVVP